MKIYNLPRRNGKTTQCILELAKNPKAVLLVANRGVRRVVIDQNRGIENIEKRVFTPYDIGDIKDYHGDTQDIEIIIDELDWVLTGLLGGHQVKLATLTGEVATTVRSGDNEALF